MKTLNHSHISRRLNSHEREAYINIMQSIIGHFNIKSVFSTVCYIMSKCYIYNDLKDNSKIYYLV